MRPCAEKGTDHSMDHHWPSDAVFYHIYTLSLARAAFLNDYGPQSHALPEIAKWLPHIKNLGCNAVLFSPVMKSRSHGYDVTDYLSIDNRIGTNPEFRALVKLFHENGVRVALDSVFNHCGRDFFAFAELLKGNRDYEGWFSGVDYGRQSPLGDPFTYDTWSGHFELPKFNLKNEAVRDYLTDAALGWIDEFDIDGMRLDAANDLDFGFMRGLRLAVTAKKADFWLMGEVVHGDYARWVNADALHSVTNYIIYKSLISSHNDNNLNELAFNQQNAVPSQGLPLYNFLDNHDQPRVAGSVKNPALLGNLYTLLFTLPGIPSIYYGSEWGIQGRKENGSDRPLRPYIDIDDPPDGAPWLEGHIRKLAGIRQGQAALRYGGYRQVYLEYRKPLVFARQYENECVYVAVNIGGARERIDLAREHCGSFYDLLSDEWIPQGSAHEIAIEPYSSRIILAV